VSDDPSRQAAQLLWETWTEGCTIPTLPDGIRPTDIAAGYNIQAELDGLAGRRVGWKIAATGAGGRAALGVEHPLAGPLFEQFAVGPGGGLDFSTVRMRIVEAEFGFVVAHDLPASAAPFDRASVLDALGAFVPALEVPNTRYTDHRSVGGAQLVADAACAGYFVFGEPVERFNSGSLPSAGVTLTTPTSTGEGSGANVLGDPVEAIRWLANALAEQGRHLRSHDTVITGSAVAVREPGMGLVTADFGALGRVSLELS
jgi:2-keto-4-pentenoate hydratase